MYTIKQIDSGATSEGITEEKLTDYAKKTDTVSTTEFNDLVAVVANKLDKTPQHEHNISNVVDLQQQLDDKLSKSTTYSYSTIISDIDKISHIDDLNVNSIAINDENVKDVLDNHKEAITQINSDLTETQVELNKSLDNLAGDLSSLEERFEKLQVDYNFSDMDKEITTNKSNIEDINLALDQEIRTNISSIQEDIETMKENISNVSTKANSWSQTLQVHCEQAYSRHNTIENKITEVQSSLSESIETKSLTANEIKLKTDDMTYDLEQDFITDLSKVSVETHDNTTKINDIDSKLSKILETIYPIGSYYISSVPTDPAELFGFGLWGQVYDKFILGYGEDTTNQELTGGSTKINVDNLPEHTHTLKTNDNDNQGIRGINKACSIASSNSYYFAAAEINITTETGVNTTTQEDYYPPYMRAYIWVRLL
jgi:predicted  nucleic acid-binding Zn-ribbon protein